MNNEATIERMKQLKLHGMARAFENALALRSDAGLTPWELISHLIDAEHDERYNRKISRLIAGARFRYKAVLQEVSYNSARNIDKNMLLRFSDTAWIKRGENIIITGATGVGKSHIACSIGNQACLTYMS
jgi:DNA replication protein DnaC